MMQLLLSLVLTLGAQTPKPAPAKPAAAADRMQTIALQVALDRAGFSTGVIDGRNGQNTQRALAAYRAQAGGDPDTSIEPLVSYRITADDAAGPFVAQIPDDLMAQASLESLGYRSIEEALSERFHTTPELLRVLNPGRTFEADAEILVPNVEPTAMPRPVDTQATPTAAKEQPKPKPTGTSGTAPTRPDVVVRVSRGAGALSVTDADGRTVFYAPVTTGSEKDPLPLGEWKVNGVQRNPPFRYNPDLFWDANPSHTKATIPPGPNGPVGLVWIDISKEHYGLHGSPEPTRIGRTESHGCVRLTNWDALRLAALVKAGTRVIFTE
jgi:lipoprotein-anchoring transpeptidase ErfK/SrfK